MGRITQLQGENLPVEQSRRSRNPVQTTQAEKQTSDTGTEIRD